MMHEARAIYFASNWRALGQIHNTYLLAQTQDGMVIVDQHAAQEQVLFERLTNKDWRLEIGDSNLKSPISNLQLMPRESELISAHLDVYRTLGIDLEPFGANTLRVNALPEFARVPANELLNALLAEHERYRSLDGDALRDKLASKCACVCALKAGDALELAQQQKLLDELLEIYSPATCPHGRPAFVAITLEELERRFLRR
jgi:DNA mismatch repair protein MutL